MAINETTVTGRKFRRLVDEAANKWERISFWHKASDCEMDNGNNLEKELQDIKDLIEDNKLDNENLSQHVLLYNEITDCYQGYFHDQWKDLVYAGFNWDGYFIKDGAINNNFCGGLMYSPNLPLEYKSLCNTTIKPPYINGVLMTNTTDPNIMNSPGLKLGREPLGFLHCYTYSESNYSTNGVSAGSLFSTFPIHLDNYRTVTIDYKIQTINKGKNTQILSFGFTTHPHDTWYSYSDLRWDGYNKSYAAYYNDVAAGLISEDIKWLEMRTCQLDISGLNGYGYFTISLINPNSTTCLNAYIYNIKFE